MAASVIREARHSCGGVDPFRARLQPLVGSFSRKTIHAWAEGLTRTRGDVVLASADIAGIDLTERLGAKSMRQELAEVKAELAEQRRLDAELRSQVAELRSRDDPSA
jgi:hypothetical protein